jgi:hypothetical protein
MKYFIFTPWAKTGGPEALHQVSHGINFCGEQSYIVYYDDRYNVIHQNEIYPEYREYDLKNANIKNIQEIDVKENVFIFPEVFSIDIINSIKNAKIIFWRLSIFTHNQHLDNPTFRNVYQGCQSNISYQILKDSNLFDMNKIFMLSDFTNQKYLKTEDEIKNQRKNIVLYSPRKGISHTLKIIEILKQNENIEFIPITNLTREQLSDIISVSKVYIDFGDHPGKDRIPRECAVGGCVVIVGTQNSGGNHIDVPIDQKFEYNIKDNSYDYHEIANFIEDAICKYSYFFDIQKNYRDIIRKEKQTFFDEIKYMIELQKR